MKHDASHISGGSGPISRRKFISGTVLTAAALKLGPAATAGAQVGAAVESSGSGGLIDTNVNLFHWPMRRLPFDEPPALYKKLRSNGVTQAWAGSFEGLLHRDMAGVNARLARVCRESAKGFWVPFGCVNPASAGWQEDLRRCHEEHSMPGVRIYPGYHGYKLDDPLFAEFLDAVRSHNLILQVAVTLEDIRVQHPRLQAPSVDLKPLPALLAALPGLKVVLLNWNRALSVSVVPALASGGNVFLDIATQEGVAGVSDLLKQVPPTAVVFGSHSPFYYFESAMLKLKESNLSPSDLAAIRCQNAAQLLGASRKAAL